MTAKSSNAQMEVIHVHPGIVSSAEEPLLVARTTVLLARSGRGGGGGVEAQGICLVRADGDRSDESGG